MYQSGDDRKGYTLKIDSSNNVLWIKCWGMWDTALAADYERDMRACYNELDGKAWFVLANISQFPPQIAEVQAAHGKLMGEAVTRGMKKAASVVESTLSKMQIRRIAQESHMSELAFHTTDESALKWLLEDAVPA